MQQPAIAVEEDPDAYEIYSVLLRTELPASWKVEAWPIRQETERGSLPMCLAPPADQLSVYRPVIEDFERRNQQRLTLQRKFSLPAYTLVNPADKTPSQNPRLLFEVSAVGFNKDHNLALVYVAHHCGGLCGGGTYHLMAKKDGKWTPDRDFRGGPGCLWVA
jgi:hypothetical protein